MYKKFVIPMLMSVVITAGCASEEKQSSEPKHHEDAHTTQTQPQLEYKIGSNDWSVITSMTDSPKVLEAYQFAVSHPEVLNYMPCYCGCFEEASHTSNTNCFVKSIEQDVAKLDSMGFGWGICVDIAREAKQGIEKGLDLKTIRANIDNKYKSTGKSTPTPMP